MSYSKEHLKEKFIEKLRENEGLIYLTASIIGIDSKTYYNWKKKDPVFKRKCRFIRRVKYDENRMRIISLAKAGHFGAMQLLDCALKEEFFSKKENQNKTNYPNYAVLDIDTRIAIFKRSLAEAEIEKLNLTNAK